MVVSDWISRSGSVPLATRISELRISALSRVLNHCASLEGNGNFRDIFSRAEVVIWLK
jgi:hypothetical protein